MPERSSLSYAPGSRAPGLRIGSQNVRGLSGSEKIPQLFRQWAVDLKLDVVCIQETKVQHAQQSSQVDLRLQLAAQAWGHPGYTAFWGYGSNSGSGVAILVRTNLLTSTEPLPPTSPCSQRRHHLDRPPQSHQLAINFVDSPKGGRYIQLRCCWAGHHLAITCVYLQSGDTLAQRTFLCHTLHPKLADTPLCYAPIVCGDFNFTTDPALDRLAGHDHGSMAGPNRRGEAVTAARMAALCQTWRLQDAFRLLHPQRRLYTWYSSNHQHHAASRLDRFYISADLQHFLESCSIKGHSAPSDHRPVVMHLRPAAPASRGRGLHRLRLTALRTPQGRTELTQLVAQLAQAAPFDDHQALVHWWPEFKTRLVAAVGALNSAHHARAQAPLSTRLEAERGLHVAHATLVAAHDAQVPAAIQQYQQARQLLADTVKAEALPVAQQARVEWLHPREQPSKLLTSLLHPTGPSKDIAALRAEQGGGLITRGPQLAARAVHHYAHVSAAPATTTTAAQAVLAAVHEHAVQLPATEVAQAGACQFSVVEVLGAITASKPGTSPGPDGIPMDLWRWCKTSLAPVLAALFTAIGTTAQLPHGFNAGAVTALHKQGDTTNIANYRPITLLNSDYRLLAKCLASRWGRPLSKAVSMEQTAFLPGRLIGHTVMLLQLLPAALRAQRRSGAIAFLDFQKAYDTVDRQFLFAVMQQVGAGVVGTGGAHTATGMVRWAQLLLTATRAVTVINGHVSQQLEWQAGVRQGCPLAPALYLFVAWALNCWLQHQGLGLHLSGTRPVPCGQYADDVAVFLDSWHQPHVDILLTTMDTFSKASGQRLNTSKSRLLPIGHIPGPPPAGVVSGLEVVTQAKTLGVIFSNNPDGCESDWPDLVQRVKHCYSKIARVSLSMFGRAFAAAGYGVSKLLYHSEYSTPPATITQQLLATTATLVDKGLAPMASPLRRGHRLPGIPSNLLPGRPESGGVGMMPWGHHITARHAVWGRRLLEGLAQLPCTDPPPPHTPPWVVAAAATLTSLRPNTHPALALLTLCSADRHERDRLPCPALRRVASALAALGPVVHDDIASLPVGPWCTHMLLWANPFLCLELPLSCRPPSYLTAMQHDTSQRPAQHPHHLLFPDPTIRSQWQARGFADLADLPQLSTLGQLQALFHRLQSPSPPHLSPTQLHRHRHLLAQGLCPWSATDTDSFLQTVVPGITSISSLSLAARNLIRNPQEVYHAVGALWQAVPRQWRTAVTAGTPDDGTVMSLLLSSFSWCVVTAQSPQPPLRLFETTLAGKPTFDVRHATSQLRLLSADPQLMQTAHMQCVHASLALAMPAATDQVQLCMRLQHRPALRLHVGVVPAQPHPPAIAVQLAYQHLRARLPYVWQLPWDNRWKEVWWRLLLGGLQGAGGHGVCLRGACPCGWDVPAYVSSQQGAAAQTAHVMWHCTTAAAVRALLQHHLPPSTPLLPHHLWLLCPPHPTIHPGVWAVVGLAALHAIYGARSYMWALRCCRAEVTASHQPQLRQLQLGDCPGWNCPPAPPAACLIPDNLAADGQEQSQLGGSQVWFHPPANIPISTMAARRAVAETLAAVHDFVHGDQVPKSWVSAQGEGHLGGTHPTSVVHVAHPFIGVQQVVSDGHVRQRLVFNMHVPPVMDL